MAVLLAERALHLFKPWVQQDICTAGEVVIQDSAVPDLIVSVSGHSNVRLTLKHADSPVKFTCCCVKRAIVLCTHLLLQAKAD